MFVANFDLLVYAGFVDKVECELTLSDDGTLRVSDAIRPAILRRPLPVVFHGSSLTRSKGGFTPTARSLRSNNSIQQSNHYICNESGPSVGHGKFHDCQG